LCLHFEEWFGEKKGRDRNKYWRKKTQNYSQKESKDIDFSNLQIK
jgi:hypothetical protein